MREQLRAFWLMLKAEVVTPMPIYNGPAGNPEQPWIDAVNTDRRQQARIPR